MDTLTILFFLSNGYFNYTKWYKIYYICKVDPKINLYLLTFSDKEFYLRVFILKNILLALFSYKDLHPTKLHMFDYINCFFSD